MTRRCMTPWRAGSVSAILLSLAMGVAPAEETPEAPVLDDAAAAEVVPEEAPVADVGADADIDIDMDAEGAPAEGVVEEAPAPVEEMSEAEKQLAAIAAEMELLKQGRSAAANHHYDLGVQQSNEGRLEEALKNLRIALDYEPNNEKFREALRKTETIAGTATDTRGVVSGILGDHLRVEHQRLWVEIQNRIAEGNRHLEVGNYNQAEQAFQMAQTRLESLPFADVLREPEMRKVESLLQITRERRARQELEDATIKIQRSQEEGRRLREQEIRIERERINMMLRRALKARERRDFDETILICEQILKINRAEGRAHRLLVTARRERHEYMRQITADRWDEEHKLLHQQIQESLLPQLDLVVYPDDWAEIDARRSAPTRSAAANTEDAAWRQDIESKLDQKLTLEFTDNEIQDVVDFLQQNTDVNFVLDPQVLADGSVPPINMTVSDLKLRSALKFIMDLTDLRYSLQDEAIFISNTEGMRGDVEMRIYDIRDLTLGLTAFPGPVLSIPTPGETGSVSLPEISDEDPPDINEFMDIIQQVVEPESWDQEGVGIDEYNRSMVVTQTPEVHDKIEELLTQLRNQRGVQINVKVKFLRVENALLEELRFEWRDFTGPPVTAENAVGTVGGTPVAFAPLGANGYPYLFGGYYNHDDYLTSAGRVGTPLADYFSQTAGMRPDGGLLADLQFYKGQDGFLGRVLIDAVEKTRRGNVMTEPDITLFSGQRSHLVRMRQQAYISDYTVTADTYDPVTSVLSYGTVIDVQAIASADKRYITLTLRPSQSEVQSWRRFGSAIPEFPAGPVVEAGEGIASNAFLGVEFPLLVPELLYEAVQTSATIPDGGSLLIAGMNRSNSNRAHSGVPFLSHIPFIGRIFSSNGRSEQELKDFIYVSGNIILFDEIEEKL